MGHDSLVRLRQFHGKGRQRLRRAMAVLTLGAFALAACDKGPEEAELGFVEDFAGLVAADSPEAALAGRDVLTRGGTATDAAVAMAFVMAVTLPSRASLGSGGACLSFNRPEERVDAISFPPIGNASDVVVLAMPRAIAALHARGNSAIRWEELLSAGENLARFGHPVSRALAQDLLELTRRGTSVNLAFAEVFSRNGEIVKEGDKIIQADLAAMLGGLRGQGINYLTSGNGAQRLVEGAADAGFTLPAESLRAVAPGLVEPIRVGYGRDTIYLPPMPSVSGVMTAQIAMMLDERGYAGLGAGDRAHLLAEASLRALADRQSWFVPGGGFNGDPAERASEAYGDQLIANYQSSARTPAASLSTNITRLALDQDGASFVVGDRYGNAVTCVFSMNTLMGTGKIAPGTGVLLAPAPRGDAQGAFALAAALAVNENTGKLIFAGASSGGPAAAANLAKALAVGFMEREAIAPVIAEPRLVHVGDPDGVAHEASLTAEQRAGLTSSGHRIGESSGFGTVNALACEDSLRNDQEDCQIQNDPRGYGLSFIVQ